jgi:hypothetical protein
MSAAYPLDLEREIDRRWLHRLVSIDHPMPLDRPKHPNDIGPPRKRTNDRTRPALENQNSRDGDEQKPDHREQGRHLMEF